jgi:hypothetical protein
LLRPLSQQDMGSWKPASVLCLNHGLHTCLLSGEPVCPHREAGSGAAESGRYFPGCRLGLATVCLWDRKPILALGESERGVWAEVEAHASLQTRGSVHPGGLCVQPVTPGRSEVTDLVPSGFESHGGNFVPFQLLARPPEQTGKIPSQAEGD